MNKRITITSFLLVVLLSSVSAQFKVVEKSAKKAPVWYQKMVEDYLIVSAHEPTLEAAQAACLQSLKTLLLRSQVI